MKSIGCTGSIGAGVSVAAGVSVGLSGAAVAAGVSVGLSGAAVGLADTAAEGLGAAAVWGTAVFCSGSGVSAGVSSGVSLSAEMETTVDEPLCVSPAPKAGTAAYRKTAAATDNMPPANNLFSFLFFIRYSLFFFSAPSLPELIFIVQSPV